MQYWRFSVTSQLSHGRSPQVKGWWSSTGTSQVSEWTVRNECERGKTEGMTDSDNESEEGFNPAITSTPGKRHYSISSTPSAPSVDPKPGPSTVESPQPSPYSDPTKRSHHIYHLLALPSRQQQAGEGSNYFWHFFIPDIYPIFDSLAHTNLWSWQGWDILGDVSTPCGTNQDSLPAYLTYQGSYEALFFYHFFPVIFIFFLY